MRIKVILDTRSQLQEFISICEKMSGPVYLSDGSREFRVSAKSTLGCILAKAEWKDIYCEYDGDDAFLLENKLRTSNLTAD